MLGVTGAMAVGLCEMACIHGKPAEPVTEARHELRMRRNQCLLLAERDAAVVDALFGADPPDNLDRLHVMSLTVPMAIAEVAMLIYDHAVELQELIDGPIVADIEAGQGVAVAVSRAALGMVLTNRGAATATCVDSHIDNRIQELQQRLSKATRC